MNKVIKLIIVAIVLYLILEHFGMLKNIPTLKSEVKEEKQMKSVSDPFSQCEYLRVIQSPKPIVIATGPAGSGKTMFGCQVAAEKLANKECKRLILTRPIVAADEDMGYLPGEMERKMEPWIRPMMDVFENYLTPVSYTHLTLPTKRIV